MKNLKAGFIAAVLIALAVLFYLQHQVQEKLHTENAALAQQLAQLQTDNENLSNRLAAAGDASSLSDKEHNELLKLRGEVGIYRWQTNDVAHLQDENERLTKANTYLPGMTFLEVSLIEQELALEATNEIIEQLARDLNVPDAIKMNVYSYINSTGANINAYHPYFRAVQSRDELYGSTTTLAKKIAQEKSAFQFGQKLPPDQ